MALTLKGIPSGGIEILSELRDQSYVPATRLRGAISKWASELSLWRRLDWKLNGIDPPGAVVPIDFEPGVLPLAIETTELKAGDPTSSAPNPTGPKLAA